MLNRNSIAFGVILAISSIGSSQAQSLQVSPVMVDLPPSSKTAVLNVANDTDEQISVQVRAFRWSLVDGKDRLDKTAEIIVSPPMFVARRGNINTLRIARIGSVPVSGEETYRIFLEEIPDRKRLQAGTIALSRRHSIPVFFSSPGVKRMDATWTASVMKGKLLVTASNPGGRRIKLSQLRITDGAVRVFVSINGLAGYVLGGQQKSWELPLGNTRLQPGANLEVDAQSESGPIHAKIVAGKSG